MDSQPLSRRRMLRLLALGGGSALLAACASSPAANVATAVPTTIAPTAALPAPTQAAPAPTQAAAGSNASQASRAAAMAQAASAFLAGLTAEQRAGASYAYGDEERRNWHWVPRTRNGMALRDMSPEQRQLAEALLQTGLTDVGFRKVLDIIALQDVEVGRDPGRYYMTIFGEPGAAGGWGWRFEGNHISINTSLANSAITMTPLFLGVVPTQGRQGQWAGVRLMDREENAARELLLSLSESDRATAIFQPNALTNLATTNARQITPLAPVGLPASSLSPAQMNLLMEIVNSYVGVMPPEVAANQLALVQNAGADNLRFGWAGSTTPGQPHYYRLQGPGFLLEFDNSRDSGRHIHSVWRDVAGDFGARL